MTEPSSEFVALQKAVAGRYSLDRELGRGGMGVVFLARDVALDRPVAIKLLPPALASDPTRRDRFVAEARTAAGLAHPNIVPIHAVERIGNIVFYIMGFINGETLGERIRTRGPLPSAELLAVLQEIAWALGHAHAGGIVHRDIKPDNVLLERGTGRALVTDFGIASTVSDGGSRPEVAGTPQFMSPEQFTGAAPDERSDAYSFGVTAYLAATGRHPFSASNVAALQLKHAQEPVPSVAAFAPHLPARLAAAIERCLAKEPGDRFASIGQVSEELSAVRSEMSGLPEPLNTFARDVSLIGRDVSSYLGTGALLVGLGQIYKMLEGDWLGIVTGIQLALAAGFLGMTLSRLPYLIPLARRAMAAGYDVRALQAALGADERLADADRRSTRRRWPGHVLVVAMGAVVMVTSVLWLNEASSDIAEAVGIAGVIGAPLMVTGHFFMRSRLGRWWHRLLRSRVGRWLFRGAGVGLKHVAALPTGGENTVAVVGHAAAELFGSLSASQRARFPDAPQVIARLEADALAAQRLHPEDPERQRLGTAMAALEALRLDLLRLHAGGGSFDDLTEDLENARRLALEMNAQADAAEEVREMLKRTSP